MRTSIISLCLLSPSLALVACSSSPSFGSFSNDDAAVLVCGPGTEQVGSECLPLPYVAYDAAPPGVVGDDAGQPASNNGSPDDAGADAVVFVPPADSGPASGFGVDPAHDNAVLDASIASPLSPKWSIALGGTASYPVVFGSTVIVAASASEPNIRAIDLATGSTVWGPMVIGSATSLAVDGDRLFALDGDGAISAYDAATGTPLWTTQLEGQVDFDSPPVASGGLVYVNGLESGGTTYAVDEATGDVIWTGFTFDGTFGAVAVSTGIVFEAEACQQVSAFNAVTGDLLWYHSTSCTGGGGETPAAYGDLLWVMDETLGNVILDFSGNVKGSFQATAIPSFHDGTVFYVNASETTPGTLTAVDVATSTLKWSFQGDGQLCSSAVIAGAGGQVFVGSASGNLYELDETTGAERSVSDAGIACSGGQMMGLTPTRLLVPAGSALVAY